MSACCLLFAVYCLLFTVCCSLFAVHCLLIMLRVGLTGSIGVGKSFVAGVLAELGCHLLDADATAREVVAPTSVALEKVVAEFGAGVLQSDGALDRTKLGNLVFSDPGRRATLNSILHPYSNARQDELMRLSEAGTTNPIGRVDSVRRRYTSGHTL